MTVTLGDAPWVEVLILSGIGLGAVIIAGIVVMIARRRMLADESPHASGLLLSDLRAMRDQGQLSEEEYQAARASLLGRMSGPDAPGEPPEPPPGYGDTGRSGR